jgi:hypothetical protein
MLTQNRDSLYGGFAMLLLLVAMWVTVLAPRGSLFPGGAPMTLVPTLCVWLLCLYANLVVGDVFRFPLMVRGWPVERATYIGNNLLKSLVLAAMTLFICTDTHGVDIRTQHAWDPNTATLGCIVYGCLDIVDMNRQTPKTMHASTRLHHIVVGCVTFGMSVLVDFTNANSVVTFVARSVFLYGVWSAAAFIVNMFLAARFAFPRPDSTHGRPTVSQVILRASALVTALVYVVCLVSNTLAQASNIYTMCVHIQNPLACSIGILVMFVITLSFMRDDMKLLCKLVNTSHVHVMWRKRGTTPRAPTARAPTLSDVEMTTRSIPLGRDASEHGDDVGVFVLHHGVDGQEERGALGGSPVPFDAGGAPQQAGHGQQFII